MSAQSSSGMPVESAKYEPLTHHFSDIDTFLHPDRDFNTAKWISLFGGLLGWDHFYLRSPATAISKFAVNIGTLGLWWIWDLCQFFLEKDRVMSRGLSLPFDWSHGLARGTFTDPASKEEPFVAQKSFVSFIILALFFGVLGLDRFYVGQYLQGATKFLSVFIFIGLIWVIWDMIQVTFFPAAILEQGYSIPLPFSAYSPWELPEATYVGDLFEVKTKLTEMLAQKTGASVTGETGSSMSKLASLAKSTMAANPLGSVIASTPMGALASRALGAAAGKQGLEDILKLGAAKAISTPDTLAATKAKAISSIAGAPGLSKLGGIASMADLASMVGKSRQIGGGKITDEEQIPWILMATVPIVLALGGTQLMRLTQSLL